MGKPYPSLLGGCDSVYTVARETNRQNERDYTRRMKSRTEYVRQECVKELRRRIATHKRFRRLVDQWIDLSIEHSRLTMQMEEPKTD
jgi:hypothetical protein